MYYFFNKSFHKFHCLTLDLICQLRIELHNLFRFVLYKVISVSLHSYEFDRLTHVKSSLFFLIFLYEIISILWLGSWFWLIDSSNFFIFFKWFFQSHPLILGWLRIRICNLFWFFFYMVISVLWPGLQVWQINSGCSFKSFLIDQFNRPKLIWLKIRIHNLF